jgi:hypothetical protein
MHADQGPRTRINPLEAIEYHLLRVEVPVARTVDVADKRPFLGGDDKAIGIVYQQCQDQGMITLIYVK